MNNRVNCWKPEMAISSQTMQKCLEGSETRAYVLTGFCANSSVEFKGYEAPRAPGRQTMQQMWSDEGCNGILWNEVAVQALSSCDMRGIQKEKQAESKAYVAGLVCKKQRSRLGAVQGIQRQAGGQRT